MNREELRHRALNLAPGGLPSPFWIEQRSRMHDQLVYGDMDNFTRWDTVGFTMFTGSWPWIGGELATIRVLHPDWIDLLTEVPLGNPEYWLDTHLSGNVIHQAYHLVRWEIASGLRIGDIKSIVEFGGGYGTLCKVVHELGFKGEYTIYDLPETALLQEWYLSNVAPHIKPTWITDPEELPKEAGLFVALWSLAEAPLVLRDKVLSSIDATNYLIGYQEFFDGYNNLDYFTRFQTARRKKWGELVADHPHGSRYLINRK